MPRVVYRCGASAYYLLMCTGAAFFAAFPSLNLLVMYCCAFQTLSVEWHHVDSTHLYDREEWYFPCVKRSEAEWSSYTAYASIMCKYACLFAWQGMCADKLGHGETYPSPPLSHLGPVLLTAVNAQGIRGYHRWVSIALEISQFVQMHVIKGLQKHGP